MSQKRLHAKIKKSNMIDYATRYRLTVRSNVERDGGRGVAGVGRCRRRPGDQPRLAPFRRRVPPSGAAAAAHAGAFLAARAPPAVSTRRRIAPARGMVAEMRCGAGCTSIVEERHCGPDIAAAAAARRRTCCRHRLRHYLPPHIDNAPILIIIIVIKEHSVKRLFNICNHHM